MLKTALIYRVKKNNYSYFIFRTVLFLLIVLSLDFAIGSLLRHYYFIQKSGSQYRTNYAIEKANADIMIFGSSRAVHHYIPTIFEAATKKSCYNAGSLDQHILYHYAVFESVLKRHIPQTVILDVTSGEFKKEAASYERLSILLPYYDKHPEIRPIVNLRSPYEKIKLLLKTYPFNSSLLMIAGGNSNYFKKRKQDVEGYVPLKKTWDEKVSISPFPPYELDTTKINYFEVFIRDCQKHNIRLYLVHSPEFFVHHNTDTSLSLVKKMAEKYGTDFIDFTNDPQFILNASLFNDPYHLNEQGAALLSKRMSEELCK